MPNLVLKSNVANKTFNVQHKVLQMPVKPGPFELIITPISKYSIDAKDFTYGLLPKEVSKIEYENLGKKVVAKVFIRSIIDLKKHLNLFIPISGRSFAEKDSFKVTTTTTAAKNIIVIDKSTNYKSVNGDKYIYEISNDLNKKILLFTKKFTITGDDYFSKIPTYTIKNNNTRFSVVSKIEKNKKGIVISKTFDFFYTSPKTVLQSSDTEILFEAIAVKAKVKTSSLVVTKKGEEQIYSIDRGRKIGPEGGIKRISIKGVPGSPFSFIISDSSNNTYSAKTGLFEESGGVVEGIIPPIAFGKSYGEALIAVKIPRTIKSQTITTNFISDKPIDHALITSPSEADIITSGEAKTVEAIKSTSVTLSVTVDATGSFSGPAVTTTGGGESTSIMLGKGNAEILTFVGTNSSLFEVYYFSFIAQKATHDKFIKIERQPLFVMPTDEEDNFVAWVSDDKADATATDGGTAIPSDWDFDDTAGVLSSTGVNVKIQAKVEGIGKPDSNGNYTSVLVKGSINVGSLGDADSEIKLKLLNFLTQATPE